MEKTIRALWISAVPKEGFRRAGFHWPHTGMGIALDSLTESQIEALRNEPMLRIEGVEFPLDEPNHPSTTDDETGTDAGAAVVAEQDQQGVAAQVSIDQSAGEPNADVHMAAPAGDVGATDAAQPEKGEGTEAGNSDCAVPAAGEPDQAAANAPAPTAKPKANGAAKKGSK